MKNLLLLLLLTIPSYAEYIAVTKNVIGDVAVKNVQNIMKVKDGTRVESSMILYTKERSSVTLIFNDNSTLILGANSILNLKRFTFKPIEKNFAFELFLQKGSLSFESGKISDMAPESFKMETPDGSVAIRGTKFFVKVQ